MPNIASFPKPTLKSMVYTTSKPSPFSLFLRPIHLLFINFSPVHLQSSHRFITHISFSLYILLLEWKKNAKTKEDLHPKKPPKEQSKKSRTSPHKMGGSIEESSIQSNETVNQQSIEDDEIEEESEPQGQENGKAPSKPLLIVKALHLLLFAMVLFPKCHHDLDAMYVQIVDDWEKIGNYNWASGVYKMVNQEIFRSSKWVKGQKYENGSYFRGCMWALLVWFYENVRPSALIEGMSEEYMHGSLHPMPRGTEE